MKSTQEAIEFLKEHSKWRKENSQLNDSILNIENPDELGEAIDIVINKLEQYISNEKEL